MLDGLLEEPGELAELAGLGESEDFDPPESFEEDPAESLEDSELDLLSPLELFDSAESPPEPDEPSPLGWDAPDLA